jgi:hypothetical protein
MRLEFISMNIVIIVGNMSNYLFVLEETSMEFFRLLFNHDLLICLTAFTCSLCMYSVVF